MILVGILIEKTSRILKVKISRSKKFLGDFLLRELQSIGCNSFLISDISIVIMTSLRISLNTLENRKEEYKNTFFLQKDNKEETPLIYNSI